jgi:hypothetical protein
MKVSFTPTLEHCQSLTDDIIQLKQSYQKQRVTTTQLQSIGKKLWNLIGLDTLPTHLEIISDQPHIHNIPWEILYHPTHGFVALTPDFHLSRSFHNFMPKNVEITKRYNLPLKILLFTAQIPLSAQHPHLLLELEQFTLRKALSPLIAAGKVQLYAPDDGRFATLCQLLQHSWDIVILSGHGSSQQDQAGIWFETDDQAEFITQSQLQQAFANRKTFSVILTACQSVKIAMDLHQLGIPHLIGMWETVLDRAACRFIDVFCTSIVVHNNIVTALQLGRLAMIELLGKHEIWQLSTPPEVGQWSLPILFSNHDSQLIVSQQFSPEFRSQQDNKFLNLFIGRRTLLRGLSEKLQQGEIKFLWLWGKTGVGKTAVAQQLALNLIENGYTVIQHSAQPNSLISTLKKNFGLERESQLDTLHYLTDKHYLLWIDGDIGEAAESLKILAQWDSPKLRIIVTARRRNSKLAHFQELQLQPIDYTDFCRYICVQGLPYHSFQLRLLYQATQGNFHAIRLLENFEFPNDTAHFWQNIEILKRYLRSITD